MTLARFCHYIDGQFEDGTDNFESIDPSTGKPWAIMPAATEADVDRAVEAAHRAFHAPEWAGLAATQRGRLLYRLADLLAENAPTLAKLETADTGKIIRETSSQIGYMAEYYRYFAGLADKVEGAHLPIDKPDIEVYLRREPIDVVAAIVPWNSQLFLSAVKLGPALAAGYLVVLKASEDGPAPLLEFARLVDAAGFPKGVVNVLDRLRRALRPRYNQPPASNGSRSPAARPPPATSSATRPPTSPSPRSSSAANRRCSCSTTSMSTASRTAWSPASSRQAARLCRRLSPSRPARRARPPARAAGRQGSGDPDRRPAGPGDRDGAANHAGSSNGSRRSSTEVSAPVPNS